MPLSYILRRVSAEAGISNPTLNTEQKAALLDIINQAAEEVYENKDLPVSLLETYLKADSNKELALPSYIGELRAVRSTLWNDSWKLQDIRPRYQSRDWEDMWNSWRLKYYSPVQLEITNSAPVTIIYPVIDTALNITIIGETTQSNRTIETKSITATSLVSTNSFLSFTRIAKSKVTDYNVTIKNADAVELAVIYADQLESRYAIVDVSQYPDLTCCSDGTYIVEVLYKPRLARLEKDEDSFPVDGMDNLIIAKSKQILAENEEGAETRALMVDQKIKDTIKRKTEHKLGTFQKKMKFGRNPLLNQFNRSLYYED